jgi:hypothetical protein
LTVVAEDTERFGPVVNSNEYASMRWEVIEEDDKRSGRLAA